MAEIQPTQQSPPRRRPRKLNRPAAKIDVEENKENEPILGTDASVEVTTDTERPTASSSKPNSDLGNQKAATTAKQRKTKPRKLLRIVPPQTREAAIEELKAGDPAEPQDNLTLRVGQLEQHVRSINRRVDDNTLDIAGLQALAARPPPRPRSHRTRSSRGTSVASARTDRTVRTNGTNRTTRPEPTPTLAEPEQNLSNLAPVQRELFRNINAATERINRAASAASARQQQPQSGTGPVIQELDDDDEDYDDIEDLPPSSSYTSASRSRAYQTSASSSSSSLTQRNVALAGSYRIPLPPSLDTADVRALKSGVAAAGSIAREISAAFRGSGRQDYVNDAVKETETLDGTQTPKSPRSWATLLSDASRMVANAANAIEFEAAVEARPQAGSSSTGASVNRGTRAARPAVAAAASRRRRALPAPSGSASGRGAQTPASEGSTSANASIGTAQTTSAPGNATTITTSRPSRRSRQAARRTGPSAPTVPRQEGEASVGQQDPNVAAETEPSGDSAAVNASTDEQAPAESVQKHD
jgi:hypothetical protein